VLEENLKISLTNTFFMMYLYSCLDIRGLKRVPGLIQTKEECVNSNRRRYDTMALPKIPDAPKDITVKQFFSEWLPEQLTGFSDIINQVGGDIQAGLSFRIEGDQGGDFSTKIEQGEVKVSEGLLDDALVTLMMAQKDFLAVITGERKMAMQMPGGGGGKEPDVSEIPKQLQNTIDTLKGVEGMLMFQITDPGEGDFAVKLKFAGPKEKLGADPDVTISIAKEDADAMAKGDLNPQAAFMSGKIKIDGDMGLLMQMAPLMMS
jgi:putative sterol carrier protein